MDVYIVNKISFPKTEFGIFQFQAPGNPDVYIQPPEAIP